MRQQLLPSKFDAEAARDFVREFCNAPTISTRHIAIFTPSSLVPRSDAPAENRARQSGRGALWHALLSARAILQTSSTRRSLTA